MTFKRAILPVALLFLGGVVLSWLTQPFAMQAMMTRMPPEALARMQEFSGSPFFWVSTVAGGLVRILGVTISAGATFLALMAVFAKPAFERVFAAAAWASLAYLLRDTVRVVTLMVRGLESVRAPEDLLPGIGMGFLVEDHRSVLYGLLELLNVYDLAFVWVFAGLLSANDVIRPRTAIIAVLIPWALFHAVSLAFRALISF